MAPSLDVWRWDGETEAHVWFESAELAELDHPFRVNVVPALLVEPHGWSEIPTPT